MLVFYIFYYIIISIIYIDVEGKSTNYEQAHIVLDLLPLVSLHIFNKIDIHKSNKTNVCISFQYIQIYRDGSTFSAGEDFLSAA